MSIPLPKGLLRLLTTLNKEETTLRIGSLFLSVIVLSSCATVHYGRVHTGKLDGKLVVEWVDPDLFIFTPDKDRPLTFVRYNEDTIRPGRMLTDGGSIPRPLWIFRNYSPWGYAPAFIIHDWLFAAKHCKYEGHERYSVEDAATIMSEVMKTMMSDPKRGSEDPLTLYAMYEAVRSAPAKHLWENGKCTPPDQIPPFRRAKPTTRYVIEFP